MITEAAAANKKTNPVPRRTDWISFIPAPAEIRFANGHQMTKNAPQVEKITRFHTGIRKCGLHT